MKTAHHRFAVAILALLVLPVPAWGADPIKAELDAARKVHADAVAAAKATFMKAFDDEIKKVATTGNLDGVKALQVDKKLAATGEKLPETHRFHKLQMACFENDSAANLSLCMALDSAVKKYTMNLEFNKATSAQNEFKDKAIAALSRLGGLVRGPSGTNVMLNKTQITDDQLVYLKAVKEPVALYLGDTKVTNAGLVHLKGLTKLEALHLHGTKITGAGLVHLEGLTKLEYLNLNGTKITDAGLVHLEGLTKLEGLNLQRTKVTDAGVKNLLRALPEGLMGATSAPLLLQRVKVPPSEKPGNKPPPFPTKGPRPLEEFDDTSILLEITVLSDGTTGNVLILKGFPINVIDPRTAKATELSIIAAVKKWNWNPAMGSNGAAVESVINHRIRFELLKPPHSKL